MGEHGMTPWRAGCAETCTSGSEGGPGKRIGRKANTAPRPDPYTYVRTWSGFVYLAFILDVYSRMIVGWQLATHLRTDLVIDAFEMANGLRQPQAGLVAHTDRGSQYTSLRYTDRLDELAIAPSVGTKGDALDNALAETFFASLEKELLRRERFATREHARMRIFWYVECFYRGRDRPCGRPPRADPSVRC